MLPQSARNKVTSKIVLKRRSDFLKTYKGLSVRMKWLVLYLRPNGLEVHRVGITVPKTVGPAVVRNRYKRWCKEITRKAGFGEFQRAFDFNIFVGSKKLKKDEFENLEYKKFEQELTSALKTAQSRYS